MNCDYIIREDGKEGQSLKYVDRKTNLDGSKVLQVSNVSSKSIAS
jgi:hypothetical protein